MWGDILLTVSAAVIGWLVYDTYLCEVTDIDRAELDQLIEGLETQWNN